MKRLALLALVALALPMALQLSCQSAAAPNATILVITVTGQGFPPLTSLGVTLSTATHAAETETYTVQGGTLPTTLTAALPPDVTGVVNMMVAGTPVGSYSGTVTVDTAKSVVPVTVDFGTLVKGTVLRDGSLSTAGGATQTTAGTILSDQAFEVGERVCVDTLCAFGGITP